MNTRQKIERELQLKEERISAWEKYGINSGKIDRDYCELPKIEYWYLG